MKERVLQSQITPSVAKQLILYYLDRILNNIQILKNGSNIYSALTWHLSKCTRNSSRQYHSKTAVIHFTIRSHLKCSFNLDRQLTLTKSTTSSAHGSITQNGTGIIIHAVIR